MFTPARNSDVQYGFDLPEIFVQNPAQIGKALVIDWGKGNFDGLGFQPKSGSELTIKVKVKFQCKKCL